MSPFGYYRKQGNNGASMLIRTPSDIGALIRERRIKLGLDQLTLAKKAGTSRKWLIEAENGKPRAEIGLILRTLKAVGITLAESSATADVPAKRTTSIAAAVDIDRVIDNLKRRR
jgi:HTH-type transcriptional regulator / antitoxin HipB